MEALQKARTILTLSICSGIIWLMIFIVGLRQGTANRKVQKRVPEDAQIAKNLNFEPDNQQNIEDDHRWTRIMMNNLESIPFGWLLILWSGYVAQRQASSLAVMIVGILYTAFRVLFTFCYAFGIQPFRTITFTLANFAVAASFIIAIIESSYTLQQIIV